MSVASEEWLDLIEREFVHDFVVAGGSMIKFAVGEDDRLIARRKRAGGAGRAARAQIRVDRHRDHQAAYDPGRVFCASPVPSIGTPMAQGFVEALFARQGYEWPQPGMAVPLQQVAERNRVDHTTPPPRFRQWLTEEVMRDPDMTQDFRVAMTRLCLHRLEPPDSQPGVTTPVIEWLRGELRSIGVLREAQITAKITRYNGRAMLRSMCRWLRLCGLRGICVTLDIRQLARTGAAVGGGLKYSPAAVMDGFEVLRQLIDDAEHFAGLLLVVLADDALIGDDAKRSLGAYQALKMRIWDDVRPEGRDNPLAPLVRLADRQRPEPTLAAVL